jgi:hypothetical protein
LISQRTLYSFLLALLVGFSLLAWRVGHHDGCERGSNGSGAQPATTIITSGTRTVAMPCDVWIPRQPMAVQAACLAELVLTTMTILFFAADRRAAGTTFSGLDQRPEGPRR